MLVNSSIRKLRIISLLLFLVPVIALIGSLLFHNYLISFKFEHEVIYDFKNDKPGNSIKILCNLENGYCLNIEYKTASKLNGCHKYNIDTIYVNNEGERQFLDTLNDKKHYEFFKETNEDIYIKHFITDRINIGCITNSNLIKYYNLTPSFFEFIYNIKFHKNTSLGTSDLVNPILYGETSISNIVKRFPIKMLFKPLMYLSVLLMILYWIFYNKILNQLLENKKTNLFYIFGILSAIFLLLHVIFLGWTFEDLFLKKLRRIYIVFFILFEVLAQAFLIQKIFSKKTLIKAYLNSIFVYMKLIFVVLICLSTVIILVFLALFDLSDKVDYILEWNYFLILLVFYLLTFFMWKKTN